MQKWENSVLEINRRESGNIKFYLDKYGEQGFELVAVAHDGEFRYCYFKRPTPEITVPENPTDQTHVIVTQKITEEEKKNQIDSIIQKADELTPAHQKKMTEAEKTAEKEEILIRTNALRNPQLKSTPLQTKKNDKK